MGTPKFTLNDVKYAEDSAMFARAEKLFKFGKVGAINEEIYGYSATVHGTHLYEVSVSKRRVDEGSCTCYMGQNDMLCKHMLALALAVLYMTGASAAPPITDIGEAKKQVNEGIKKLRPYNGPSRIWFSYQRGLSVGAGMIMHAVSGLPASKENAEYLWELVLRLSDRLATSGIDDSDGTVGNCVSEIVLKLGEIAKKEPSLKPMLERLSRDDTGFGFEDELRDLLRK